MKMTDEDAMSSLNHAVVLAVKFFSNFPFDLFIFFNATNTHNHPSVCKQITFLFLMTDLLEDGTRNRCEKNDTRKRVHIHDFTVF